MYGDETRILLVDDEDLVLRSMEKTLLRAGFEVETAQDAMSGQAFFEAARDAGQPFTLAILDLNMPGLDGEESATAGLDLLVRLREVSPDLPVVILSAFDEVDLAKKVAARGARAYFVKGREGGLVDLVRRIIDVDQGGQ